MVLAAGRPMVSVHTGTWPIFRSDQQGTQGLLGDEAGVRGYHHIIITPKPFQFHS